MNARSLCLISTLLVGGIPAHIGAQPSKPNTSAQPVPATAAGTLQLRKEVPGEFEYRFLTSKGVSSAPNALPTGTDNLIALSLSAEYKGGTLEIQDTTRGDMARFPVKTGSMIALTESSFKFVRVVNVPVMKEGKPATGVLVSLTSEDGSYNTSRTLQPADAGIARFDNVPLSQKITATVKFGRDEKSGIQTLTRNHPAEGVKWDTIDVAWKDVKTIAAPAVPANSGAVPAPTGGTVAPPTLPQTTPAIPEAASGGGLGGVLNTLISLGLLAGIAYGLYWAYQNGKIKILLERLGINTATLTTPDAGAVAANPFQKNAAPVQPISDGTADPFAGGTGTVGIAVPSAPVGSGLRLVATMGTYAGQIYPLTGGTIEIGRDAANAIPLPNDTNASRRHATLQLNSAQIMVTDNASSNGTFINGVRIATQTPTPLNPRDELTVGNTRFRFEA